MIGYGSVRLTLVPDSETRQEQQRNRDSRVALLEPLVDSVSRARGAAALLRMCAKGNPTRATCLTVMKQAADLIERRGPWPPLPRQRTGE